MVLAPGSKKSEPCSVEDALMEIAQHEYDARDDIRSQMGALATNATRTEFVEAYRRTWRRSLVDSLRDHRSWSRETFDTSSLTDGALFAAGHLRPLLAPSTGSIGEAGKTLVNGHERRSEFQGYRDTWLSGSVDQRGLSAVQHDRELTVVEGCHRLIALAWVLADGFEASMPRTVRMFVGRP